MRIFTIGFTKTTAEQFFGRPAPHACHRRLIAEHLHEAWGDVEIQHLQPHVDADGTGRGPAT